MKHHRTRKAVSLLLSLLMAVQLLPLEAGAASEMAGKKAGDVLFNNGEKDRLFVSETAYSLAPGITEYVTYTNEPDGLNQNIDYFCEVDLSQAEVMTGYAGMENILEKKTINWRMQTVSGQVEDTQSYFTRSEKYADCTIAAALNADYYNMATGQPTGLLIIDGTVYKTREPDASVPSIMLPAFPDMQKDPRVYAESFSVQYRNTDPFCAKRLIEPYGTHEFIVQNPPQKPLSQKEMDRVYDLPYCRTYHPSYKKLGGIPAIAEIEFSLTSCRGCFGACSFCALTFHQGRIIQTRSQESILREAETMTHAPGFKGYIHDVGGPTANFRQPACKKQLQRGACPTRQCLFPTPCKNLRADHSEYVRLLREVESLPGIKKVFIRSGIRFDYLLCDKNPEFFRKLVRDHVSGQLKVAPEHCSPNVLRHMGKPDIKVYDRFREKFFEYSAECGLEQYLVPYLMSSHPGSRMEDAVELALYTKRIGLAPEQVQDYYPTPGTASTVMYYTGLDPFTMKEIYTPTDYHEKQLQRALLQWRRRENWPMVREALRSCGRDDLIGYGGDCLVPPEKKGERSGSAGGNSHAHGGKQSGNHKGGGSSRGNRGKAAQSKGANKESGRSKGSARTNGSAVESKRNTQTGSKNPRTPKNDHRSPKKKK